MVYKQDIKSLLFIIFVLVAGFMAGCYFAWLPNPTINSVLGPLTEPTFLWEFSHFFAIAFWRPPFAYLFWGLVIVHTFSPVFSNVEELEGEFHLLRRLRKLAMPRGKWVRKGNLYTYSIKERNVK